MRLADLHEMLEEAHTIDDYGIYDNGYLSWVQDVLGNIISDISKMRELRAKKHE